MSDDYKGFSVETIGKNIASKMFAGYSHKQAIEVTLENARDDYRKKHPSGSLPPHLQDVAGLYSKNPVKAKKRKRAKIKVKSIKQQAGGTISIDGKRVKSAKPPRRGQNPVRPLKKKLLNKYYLGVSKGTKIYYWINDTRFDTSRKNAAIYTSAEVALKKAKNLGTVLNKFIGVYRSK